jgi:hypothetical protein
VTGAYTVTATNTDGSNGITLQVEVITGAAEAGGASGSVDDGVANGTGSGTAFTLSLTPNFSGSFIAWAASEASSGFAAISGAANNKLLTVAANADTFEDTTNNYTSGAGYYSGSVTSGTPVTVGANNTGVSASGPQLAVYEVKPNPSWAEDLSTPAWVNVTGANAATTASFTPPAGAVLVALVSCNFSATGTGTGSEITVASTPSLTWTLRASNSTQANDGGTAVYTATIPGAGLQDIPQIRPGPVWLDLFKPGFPKPRPPVTPPSPVYPGPLTEVPNGASLSDAVPGQAIPGFIPGIPPAGGITSSGSFALAPLALAGNGAQSSPDIPRIAPGSTWLDLFKPGLPKPRPQLPYAPPVTAAVSSTGSFSLAPLALTSNGAQTSPDVPQFQPGPYWLSWFKPGIYKPVPPLPAVQGVNVTGSFTLASLAFQGQGSQSSPDIPNILPGTTWLDLFKPGFPKPRPVPPVVQGINAAGSFSLAPLALAAQGSQTSPDIRQILPGTTWLDLFKPGLNKPRPVPPAIPDVSATGSLALAPLAFAGTESQASPDQPQILPGPYWLQWFKPGIYKPVPPPPAIPAVSGTASLALAPFAFLAQGAVSAVKADDLPQINPGYRWLALFKHWQRPSGSPSLAVPRNTESGPFNIYLPGGCIRFGTPVITLPALKVTLQGYAGRFGPVTVALPSLATSLTGLHSPLWPGFRIPALRVSLTGKIQGGAFNITLPAPKTAITGTITHVHSGPFALSLTCKSGMGGIVWLSLAPPAPSPDPVDWIASQPVTAWRTYLPSEAWSVGYASVTISHLSTQYVLIPVQASKNGSSYNPTSDTVQFAFAPTPTYVPQVSDWVSGSWVTNSNNILYPYSAQCLVGPGGTALGLGTYQIYIKISDSPETPVLVAGQVVITLWKSRWVMFMFPGPQTSPQSPGRQDNGYHSFHDVH